MPKIVAELLARFPELTIVHQVGGRNGDSTAAAYALACITDPRLKRTLYLDAMVDEIAAADLILCRSGASTVAELAAAGRASILVPFAAAADDHQRRNAEVFVEAGAAAMILEVELTPERATSEITHLLEDAAARQKMADAARTLAHANAAGEIAQLCVALAFK